MTASMLVAAALAASPLVTSQPDWLIRPTPGMMSDVYPIRALMADMGGWTYLRCTVQPTGALTGCTATRETPTGMGFGAAAVSMAPRLRMKPGSIAGRPSAMPVVIPVTFIPDDDTKRRAVWREVRLALLGLAGAGGVIALMGAAGRRGWLPPLTPASVRRSS